MKKIISIILLISFIGCYSVKYATLPNTDVKVLSETEYGKVKVEKKVWYALWGLIPITDNSTADIIQKYNLKRVKAESKIKFLDFVINYFTSFATIVCLTLEVEGEPAQ